MTTIKHQFLPFVCPSKDKQHTEVYLEINIVRLSTLKVTTTHTTYIQMADNQRIVLENKGVSSLFTASPPATVGEYQNLIVRIFTLHCIAAVFGVLGALGYGLYSMLGGAGGTSNKMMRFRVVGQVYFSDKHFLCIYLWYTVGFCPRNFGYVSDIFLC